MRRNAARFDFGSSRVDARDDGCDYGPAKVRFDGDAEHLCVTVYGETEDVVEVTMDWNGRGMRVNRSGAGSFGKGVPTREKGCRLCTRSFRVSLSDSRAPSCCSAYCRAELSLLRSKHDSGVPLERLIVQWRKDRGIR